MVTTFAFQDRLLARRASRRPGPPLEQKMKNEKLKKGGKGKLFSIFNISETKYLQFSLFIIHLTF
jgi:hypothetical protein